MIADPSWKSALLHKSQDVTELLDAALDGKEVDLASLPVPSSPDQDPVRRLRRFLDQIERAIERFDSDAFGRCEVCSVNLDRATLQRQPWLATCSAHTPHWLS